MDSSHQYPASRSCGVNGSGSRASQRWKNTFMVPGPSRSQIACKAAGSSVSANPLDSSANPIPACAAWRLAHSCHPDLDRPRTVGADLDERRTEIGVPEIKVVDRDAAVLLVEGELRRLGRVGVALAGGEYPLRVLRDPDRRHL